MKTAWRWTVAGVAVAIGAWLVCCVRPQSIDDDVQQAMEEAYLANLMSLIVGAQAEYSGRIGPEWSDVSDQRSGEGGGQKGSVQWMRVGRQVSLRSAGPDDRFGTSDDRVITWETDWR